MSDYFPSELLIEILVKLPVKSLIRFSTVCKSWHSLITDPTFISSHLSSTKNHALLLRRYDKHDKAEHYSLLKLTENGLFGVSYSSELEFPFKSQIGYFRIVGTCDGLVCLSDDFFANPSQPVIIWNPSIQNHLLLPRASINPIEPHVFVLGFGVDRHVYKVVRLVYYRKRNDFGYGVPPQAEIFNLKTGKWRKLRGIDVRLQILEFMWSQAFLKGIIHWLAYESINDNSSRSSILSFGVGNEVFGEVILPDELVRETVTNLSISCIGESLGVMKYDREVGNESCDVWLMKEYGVKESWMKLYRVALFQGMERVVTVWKNGEALLASRELQLVAYDPQTKMTMNLGIYGTTRSFYIDYYVESLLLFKGLSGPVEESSGYMEEFNVDGCCIV